VIENYAVQPGRDLRQLVRGPAQKFFVSLEDFDQRVSECRLLPYRLWLGDMLVFLDDRFLSWRSDARGCHKNLLSIGTKNLVIYPALVTGFSFFILVAVGIAANTVRILIASGMGASFAILLRIKGLRTNSERIAAMPHSAAEM